MQVREEAEKAFGPGDSAPSRAAADAMTYTVCALQVGPAFSWTCECAT